MRADARHPDARRASRSRGFTLVELLVTISIVAVLAGLAMPSFSNLVAGQRIRSAGTDLHTALTKARSEALKRNANVRLAPKDGSNWANGWRIVEAALPDTVLEDHNGFQGITMTGPTEVIYASSGRIRGTNLPNFQISGSASAAVSCISVNLSGMPAQRSSAC